MHLRLLILVALSIVVAAGVLFAAQAAAGNDGGSGEAHAMDRLETLASVLQGSQPDKCHFAKAGPWESLVSVPSRLIEGRSPADQAEPC